jgi:hypothetical protein
VRTFTDWWDSPKESIWRSAAESLPSSTYVSDWLNDLDMRIFGVLYSTFLVEHWEWCREGGPVFAVLFVIFFFAWGWTPFHFSRDPRPHEGIKYYARWQFILIPICPGTLKRLKLRLWNSGRDSLITKFIISVKWFNIYFVSSYWSFNLVATDSEDCTLCLQLWHPSHRQELDYRLHRSEGEEIF